MAAVVSHAMRRFAPTQPDAVYSYGLRPEGSHKAWSPSEDGESALSRSMRYADPWLYGSVRAPGGLVLAPAFVLCACSDYVNGTKRSSKKSPSTCKKCKGTRLPLSSGESKFGTVRCYPTATTATPLRAGTMRVVSSSSRPSILPSADPYDLMRRSRLSVSESTSQFRARSISPNKAKSNESRSHSATRHKKNHSSLGRRSILECDINPYELMSTEPELRDSSITLVNGQRIRVRPQSTDSDYEDVQIRRPPKTIQIKNKNQSSPKTNEKESESNRFKSILKKPTTTFSDTDSNSREHSPSPAQKSGSHFYLPMPGNTPRKKVQFLVENELECQEPNNRKDDQANYVNSDYHETIYSEDCETETSSEELQCEEDSDQKVCKLRRSVSERFINHETKRVVFHDTMALRSRTSRSDSRITFAEQDLERLDGLTSKTRRKSPTKIRPNKPPPPPPPSEEKTISQSNGDVKCKEKSSTVETINNKKKSKVNDEEKQLKPDKEDASFSLNKNEMNNEFNTESENKRKFSVEKIISVFNQKHESNNESNNKRKLSNENNYLPNEINKEIKIKSNNKKNMSVENVIVKDNEEDVKKSDNKRKISIENTLVKDNQKIGEINKSDNKRKVSIEKIIPKENEKSEETKVFDTKRKISVESSVVKNEDKIEEIKKEEKVAYDPWKKEVADTPPSAPPRKRSHHKQPQVNIVRATSPNNQSVQIESPTSPINSHSNKTIVQINGSPTVHKLQIKNEFTDVVNVQTVSVFESPQRKTSIMITGDDCYSTVNVNDDVPLYQSSVVVKDTVAETTVIQNCKKSSSVYITGNFVNSEPVTLPIEIKENVKTFNETNQEPKISKDYEDCEINNTLGRKNDNVLLDTFNENNIPSSELLMELLRDPVEAVRRNLVPHVCGKSDVPRRRRDKKLIPKEPSTVDEPLVESSLESMTNFVEDSFLQLRNYESMADDLSSEHSSSTQYELMDAGSECYTDHSNRSSVTEEELTNRTKFYELLADPAVVEVSENEDHHYESIKMNSDPIYEEIEIPPPLPTNPPPLSLLDDLHLDKEYTTRSIFEGASKYDILSYLVDAKERGIAQEDNYTYNFVSNGVSVDDDAKESYNRVCHMSTVSDSSEDNSLIMSSSPLIDDKNPFQKTAEVERNDSGVGSETSKSSLSKYRMKQETSVTCEDCETVIESSGETEPLICRKCIKKRSERKEIITEIVETEEKYSRDLQIILEEFYQPMLVAGLLTPDQLSAIFLNVEELLENSQSLAERLRDAVEIAIEQGDEDLLTVNIGKLFLEAAPMLHGFETYCVRQGAASLLLASLEKEKELLRIFLRVSQMENTMLRRMNLNSFLMVPVQRVTKYPLLLARLYKVTPSHHETKEQLKEAQHKIELHLNHMNSETKDVPSKLWRRIGSSSGRRSSAEMDLVNIKLRKIAVDVLEWNHDEAKFALEGKLLFTQPTDNNWRKGRTIKLTPVNALLVINGKPSTSRPERNDENGLIFSRHSAAREAALLLVRDKNGRYSLLREPLYLDRCVIAADPAWQSYFEVQELLGKDTFIFKAEDEEQTKTWYTQLQYHAQGMGAWRKRRNALANIMINGMGLRS